MRFRRQTRRVAVLLSRRLQRICRQGATYGQHGVGHLRRYHPHLLYGGRQRVAAACAECRSHGAPHFQMHVTSLFTLIAVPSDLLPIREAPDTHPRRHLHLTRQAAQNEENTANVPVSVERHFASLLVCGYSY